MEKKRRSVEELKQLQKELDPKEVAKQKWEANRQSTAPSGRVVARKAGIVRVLRND